MRNRLLTFVLLAACGEAATPPVPEPVPEVPAAWPTPSLSRVAQRTSATDRLSVTLPDAHADARVELRVVRGPTPASCDDTHETRTLTAGADGIYGPDTIGPDDSATICVRDADGHVRATATSPGFRTVPNASAMWRDGQVFVEQTLEPLDEDVTAVVLVSRHDVETAIPALGCRTMAASDADEDDPPERCTYDCAAEHVVLEIPRAAWDAVLASPSFHVDPDAHDELLYPPTIGAAFPVTIPAEHDATEVCVRTRDGALVADDALWSDVAEGPWDGCPFETVAGCLGMPSSFGDLVRGDVLLGATADGTVVRAPVRRARTHELASRDITTTRGVLGVANDRLVRMADGSDVLAGDLAPGAHLWSRRGDATVLSIATHDDAYPEPSVDLEGAVYFLTSGFAVRDDGGPETTTAPTHVDDAMSLGGGDGDCALQAEWTASATPGGVVVHVAAFEGHDRHVTRDASCGAGAIPAATIDAPTLAAIASIAPGARIQVQLYGSAVACSGDYWVSRCDAADAVPIGAAMSWLASPQCLPEGTPIDTPHGPIAIEKLERGDVVTTYDAARGLGIARVLGSTSHGGRAIVAVTLDDGTELRATPEHLAMVGTPPRAVPMSEVVIGDVLSVHRGETVAHAHVVARDTQRPRTTVVELRVTAPDTYFASGVLVHNY